MVTGKITRPLVSALKGTCEPEVPFWFMRQAGRYLPEFRAKRLELGSFLNLCYSPEDACEVTLQPLRRFPLSAAIIFSDILVIPHAMGIAVDFLQGEGPRVGQQNLTHIPEINPAGIEQFLAPMYGAMRLVRAKLPEEKALIGFSGAPWTLACYLLGGETSASFCTLPETVKKNPSGFEQWLRVLEQAIVIHLSAQVKAGADAVQMFDSWAGLVQEDAAYADYIIAPTRRIVEAFHTLHPQVPFIGFPRNSGERYRAFAEQTGVNAVGLDYDVPLEWAVEHLAGKVTLQGNLSPHLLAEDCEAALAQTKKIVEAFAPYPFVFNLGHGMVPHMPIENVARISEWLHGFRR